MKIRNVVAVLMALVATVIFYASSGAPVSAAPVAGAESQQGSSSYVQAANLADALRQLDVLGSSSGSTATAAGAEFGPCQLDSSNLYLRTSSGRSDVGFKPKTTCSVAVTSIKHESDLRYKATFWHTAQTFVASNRGVASLEQKNISRRCAGTNHTEWAGLTLGTVVYQGKTYYARVYRSNTVSCKA